MTRPRGEIRQALGAALAQRSEPGAAGGSTWRELATHAGVAFDAAKQTVRDMVRSGELAVVGEVRVPGARRPMQCYLPAQPEPDIEAGADLAQAIRCWADFR